MKGTDPLTTPPTTRPAFTPGPWRWSAKTTPPYDITIYTHDATLTVARILGGNGEDHGDELVQELAEADARLIAAAPELYEALRVAEGYINAVIETYRSTVTRGGDMSVLSQVRAALAKADGRE